MKILIVLLLLLLGASSPATSQIFGRKKALESLKTDSKSLETPKTNLTIDSLTKANQALTTKTDLLSKELKKYFGVYSVIKDKLIHYNFDPAKMSFLIDSLKTSKDSTRTMLSIKPNSTALSDSIAMLLKGNSMLKANLDSVKAAWERSKTAVPADEVERARAISNLKRFKELLDAKIISDAEFLALKHKYLNDL